LLFLYLLQLDQLGLLLKQEITDHMEVDLIFILPHVRSRVSLARIVFFLLIWVCSHFDLFEWRQAVVRAVIDSSSLTLTPHRVNVALSLLLLVSVEVNSCLF